VKILVAGLDCAAPERLLGDERLTNMRRLMTHGCYGRLESVIPPITVPAWMCFATSQDPGSLGVYGFRNRADYSYDELQIVDARAIRETTVWDRVAMEGGRSIVIGVPPSYPPRRINGISVGCFLTPDTEQGVFTHPPQISDRIRSLVGNYPVDVKGFRTDDKEWLRKEIYEMTDRHFTVIRHFLEHEQWDYLQFVEIGLDRIHHGFWKDHDPRHVQHDPASPYRDTVVEYYRYLDHELGRVLELLDDDTLVLVLSDHGARSLDGGFCVNEWLRQEGFLVLRRQPHGVTRITDADVDWKRTTAWAEGGYYGRIFLNVHGREPQGTIPPADYERVRDDLKERLEATVDDKGQPLGTLVFKPDEIYQSVNNIAPDLIAHFGGLAWRAIGGVGYESIHVQENDTGPDDCNHAQYGAFILAAPNVPAVGELEGVRLIDLAPTILALAGYQIPPSMQGRPFLAASDDRNGPPPLDNVEAVRRRLRGLGYIS
jgi:predicted AlkP superfamily phosphohydrolase/phosphomutase